MSNLVYRRQFPIEWGHCDPAGIVFNSRFFEFFDWSAWKLFETALGVRPSDLAATYGIVGIPLVDAKANFMRPARINDMVEIASEISRFGRASFEVQHRISVGGDSPSRAPRPASGRCRTPTIDPSAAFPIRPRSRNGSPLA